MGTGALARPVERSSTMLFAGNSPCFLYHPDMKKLSDYDQCAAKTATAALGRIVKFQFGPAESVPKEVPRVAQRNAFQFTVKPKFVVDDGLVASELLSVNAFTVTV